MAEVSPVGLASSPGRLQNRPRPRGVAGDEMAEMIRPAVISQARTPSRRAGWRSVRGTSRAWRVVLIGERDPGRRAPRLGGDEGNMQSCGVDYAANAIGPSTFAGRQPG